MENDQWPSARTLGNAIYDDNVLDAAGMAPHHASVRMDLDQLASWIGMSMDLPLAVYKAVEFFIERMHEVHRMSILRTGGPDFRQEVRTVMAKIADIPKGNVRSKLRDEVVFVALIKLVEHSLTRIASNSDLSRFDHTKLQGLVRSQIRRLFSKKIQDVSLSAVPDLPNLEQQEQLYELLVPQLKTAHATLKSF